MAQYERLLDSLKKRCGGERPTLEQIEDAMDNCGLPSDYEVEVDKLILDLSCHEIDHVKRQMANETKRCDELKRRALKL